MLGWPFGARAEKPCASKKSLATLPVWVFDRDATLKSFERESTKRRDAERASTLSVPMRGSVSTVGVRDLRHRRNRAERATYSPRQLGSIRRNAGATRSADHAGSLMCSCNVCSRSSRPDATINAARHVVSRDAIARHARHVEPHRTMEMGSRNANIRAIVWGVSCETSTTDEGVGSVGNA